MKAKLSLADLMGAFERMLDHHYLISATPIEGANLGRLRCMAGKGQDRAKLFVAFNTPTDYKIEIPFEMPILQEDPTGYFKVTLEHIVNSLADAVRQNRIVVPTAMGTFE